MYRCLFVFAVACVKSAEYGTPPNNLGKSQDWPLPLEVTTLVADNCDLSSKHALSLTSTVLRKASEPLLAQIKLQKARHIDHMVLQLESIVPMYRRNGYKIPEFDARREIMHYLNGFHGHVEWLVVYLEDEGAHSRGRDSPMRTLWSELEDHRRRYHAEAIRLPPHLWQSAVIPMAKRPLFDAYGELRNEAERVLDFNPWKAIQWKSRAVLKLVVEEIGVRIEYPTLKEMQWSMGRDMTTPKQWNVDNQKVNRCCSDAMGTQIINTPWLYASFDGDMYTEIKEFVDKLKAFGRGSHWFGRF